ncbi:hypothetical protein ATANTOWER_013356 [Ataeniobius toweri]|uniref:Uncharacterized protein n=1 Tax=Ataeniobius toweri TaxID=208326 RepID=A0ABU7AFR5_9TELE|nr:hypothetical protein [Ataeniobius toweri]
MFILKYCMSRVFRHSIYLLVSCVTRLKKLTGPGQPLQSPCWLKVSRNHLSICNPPEAPELRFSLPAHSSPPAKAPAQIPSSFCGHGISPRIITSPPTFPQD